MSNPNTAEEIADKQFKNAKARKKLWHAYLEEDEMSFIEAIGEVEETHTAQTLDRLKERVDKLDTYYYHNVDEETSDITHKTLEDVLQLIEEVSDDD